MDFNELVNNSTPEDIPPLSEIMSQEPVEEVKDSDLDPEQLKLINALAEWFEKPVHKMQKVTLGGYAGTGKTVTISKIVKRIREKGIVHVAAYTGKAVDVLRSKGLKEAQTCHSLCYNFIDDEDSDNLNFELKPALGVRRLIIDEASMVTTDIYNYLNEQTYNIPSSSEFTEQYPVKVLYVGDHGQLEPIGDNPHLMRNPDFILDKIHRNAGEIAKRCEMARLADWDGNYRGKYVLDDYESETVHVLGGEYFDDFIDEADCIIVGTNETRHSTNQKVRAKRGYKKLVEEGEKVICLQNNKKKNIYNGKTLTVTQVFWSENGVTYVDLEDENGNTWHQEPLLDSQFGNRKQPYSPECIQCDYGYAQTAHKVQGSEYSKVLVLDEVNSSWNINKWRYTAWSRAKKHLRICR